MQSTDEERKRNHNNNKAAYFRFSLFVGSHETRSAPFASFPVCRTKNDKSKYTHILYAIDSLLLCNIIFAVYLCIHRLARQYFLPQIQQFIPTECRFFSVVSFAHFLFLFPCRKPQETQEKYTHKSQKIYIKQEFRFAHKRSCRWVYIYV